MDVDHVGTGGQVPLEFGVKGTLMQIVPLRFCHIGTKRAFCGLQSTLKSRTPLGELTTLLRTLYSAEEGTPLIPPHTPSHSGWGMGYASPQNSSQIYAYVQEAGFRSLLHYLVPDRRDSDTT